VLQDYYDEKKLKIYARMIKQIIKEWLEESDVEPFCDELKNTTFEPTDDPEADAKRVSYRALKEMKKKKKVYPYSGQTLFQYKGKKSQTGVCAWTEAIKEDK
jgi:hypothetical protein